MGDPLNDSLKPRKSWWGRNWFWVVPLGCLTPLMLMAGCGVAMFVGVMSLLKSSDVYTQSLAAVQGDPRVAAALGEPIEPSFFLQGNINYMNDGGDANITYSVSGPKGTASVHAVATRAAGVWTYQTHDVQLPNGEKVAVPVAAEQR
jgi:hypothetical protein